MRQKTSLLLLALLVPTCLINAAASSATESSGPRVLFASNFEGLKADREWEDGTRHGGWVSRYDGYGRVAVATGDSKHLIQRPQASTTGKETHASLVTTKASFTDIDARVTVRTVEQLRTPAPNPWETAWVVWDYVDDVHFYYLALKPNGWELGKEDPAYPGAQRFLATGASPTFPVDTNYRVRVVKVGSTMTVWVDGTKLTSFTDEERPYGGGSFGLYNEDAEVWFDNVKIVAPGN